MIQEVKPKTTLAPQPIAITEHPLMVYSFKTVDYDYLLDKDFRKELLGTNFTIVTGGFDLTHFNHLIYLKEISRATGKPLLVLPDTDVMLDGRKSKPDDKRPVMPFEQRAATLGLLNEVTVTAPHPGDDFQIVDDLVREGVTLIRSTHTHGGITDHDKALFEKVENYGGTGLIMPASGFFEGIGTTDLIKKIKARK